MVTHNPVLNDVSQGMGRHESEFNAKLWRATELKIARATNRHQAEPANFEKCAHIFGQCLWQVTSYRQQRLSTLTTAGRQY
jgi:hypothetical protein